MAKRSGCKLGRPRKRASTRPGASSGGYFERKPPATLGASPRETGRIAQGQCGEVEQKATSDWQKEESTFLCAGTKRKTSPKG